MQRGLGWVGAHYIRFVHATSRWTVYGEAIPRRFWPEGKPFIAAFWHGRMLMTPYIWDPKVKIRTLISGHSDGRLISRTIGHFGLSTIEGSTSRGGTAALRAILKTLAAGHCIGVTPDGPRGPRMRASLGIVNIARKAGVPIVPLTFSATRRRVTESWDRFIVALPFSRGVIIWGEPIWVAEDAEGAILEDVRLALENRLNAITREADRLCGHGAVEPAPGPAEDAAGQEIGARRLKAVSGGQ